MSCLLVLVFSRQHDFNKTVQQKMNEQESMLIKQVKMEFKIKEVGICGDTCN